MNPERIKQNTAISFKERRIKSIKHTNMTNQDQLLKNMLLTKELVHRLDMEQQVDKQPKFMVTWLLANGEQLQFHQTKCPAWTSLMKPTLQHTGTKAPWSSETKLISFHSLQTVTFFAFNSKVRKSAKSASEKRWRKELHKGNNLEMDLAKWTGGQNKFKRLAIKTDLLPLFGEANRNTLPLCDELSNLDKFQTKNNF